MQFFQLENFIYRKLEQELSQYLYYHSISHVRDVMSSAIRIAEKEGIDEKDLMALKTAVLFHDVGFVIQGKEHEQIGCEMAREILPGYDYIPGEIERICGMIMATKIPQSPKTLLEEIICDADLDYLGRDDYWTISNNLYKEIIVSDILEEKNWIKLQINFLEQHRYFTLTAKKDREEKKAGYLAQLKKNLLS